MTDPQQISVKIADAPEVIALLKRAEHEIVTLRAALVGLVGADGERDLREMANVITDSIEIPTEDRAVALAGIRALLDTLPASAEPTGA